jgi:hypothetical protein
MTKMHLINTLFFSLVRRIIRGLRDFFRFTEADARAILSAFGYYVGEMDNLRDDHLHDRKEASALRPQSELKVRQRENSKRLLPRYAIDEPGGSVRLDFHPDFRL